MSGHCLLLVESNPISRRMVRLALENARESEIVGAGGEDGAVGGKGDRRKARTLEGPVQDADELGGDMLNARRSYLGFANFDVDAIDPYLRFATLLRVQDGLVAEVTTFSDRYIALCGLPATLD